MAKERGEPADEDRMFEWTKDYAIGLPQVDAQHQAIFRMARELYDEMSAGRGKDVVGRILRRVVEYTEHHFAAEERLMRQYNYPELAAHREQHQDFARRVQKFQDEFQAGRTMMTVEVFRLLRDWLEVHIKGSDMAYAEFIRAKAA